jgi:hypothetical protein
MKKCAKGDRPQWHFFSKMVPLGSVPFGTIFVYLRDEFE